MSSCSRSTIFQLHHVVSCRIVAFTHATLTSLFTCQVGQTYKGWWNCLHLLILCHYTPGPSGCLTTTTNTSRVVVFTHATLTNLDIDRLLGNTCRNLIFNIFGAGQLLNCLIYIYFFVCGTIVKIINLLLYFGELFVIHLLLVRLSTCSFMVGNSAKSCSLPPRLWKWDILQSLWNRKWKWIQNLHERESDAMHICQGGHGGPHVGELGCVLVHLCMYRQECNMITQWNIMVSKLFQFSFVKEKWG